MKCRWTILPQHAAQARRMALELKVSPLLAQCLINRGIAEGQAAAAFLEPRLKNLSDPFLLPDMEAAVQRLVRAREQKERVVIFGDYDVDGVTSTALLVETFTALGWSVECYLPHRVDEGYGLSREGVANCIAKFPATLLLAVDCGSNAVESIRALKADGVDVIVLDHHQVSDPAPEAVALVNPQRNPPAFTEMCSVGLAFKLAHALVKRGRECGWTEALRLDVREYLDLVALGTVADVVPLCGENRVLVSAGLLRLDQTQRPGLIALKEVAQTPSAMGVHEIGFQLGPRLNAAGRIENAEEALQLLFAADPCRALELARSLDGRNRERQRIERGIVEEVARAVRARFDAARDFCVVEGESSWHIGVVGIVASRLVQEFYRPAIILGGEGAVWRGSGRSIEGFDLAAALRECGDLLVRHGGHAMAAGLTIDPANIAVFRERFNEIARRQLSGEELKPLVQIDAEVALGEISPGLIESLDRLKPCGIGNPAPKLLVRGACLRRPPSRFGKERQHARFLLADEARVVEAVLWNCGENAVFPPEPFDLVVTPQMREFNGVRSVQLRVLDWRGRELQ